MADSHVNIEVNWFGEPVMRKLTAVTATSNKRLALMMERQAKLNIREPFEHKDGEVRSQIDTGAMINSTRAVLAGGIDGALGAVSLPFGVDAMVMSPMDYAVYQESIRPFFWPAAEQVASEAEGVIFSTARGEGVS